MVSIIPIIAARSRSRIFNLPSLLFHLRIFLRSPVVFDAARQYHPLTEILLKAVGFLDERTLYANKEVQKGRKL